MFVGYEVRVSNTQTSSVADCEYPLNLIKNNTEKRILL